MALPKRKHSSARRDKRRSHIRLSVPGVTRCPQCAKTIIPHRVCMACGYYRNRSVLVIREKKSNERSK